MKRLYHLELKIEKQHKYYGDLAGVFLDNKDLGVSKYTLDRYDFSTQFENDVCIIRKGFSVTAKELRKPAPK